MSKKIWGAAFIAAAAAVILSRTGVRFGEMSLIRVVIAVLMLPMIADGIKDRSFFGILVPAAVILWMFEKNLGIERLAPMPILSAAVLASVGLEMIFPGKTVKKVKKSEYINVIGETIYISANFSGSKQYITSQTLSEVNIDAVCGGAEIYLDDAKPVGQVVTVNINMSCAGATLYIPHEWEVKDFTDKMMSGISEGGVKGAEKSGVVIELHGRLRLSGIEIKYV